MIGGLGNDAFYTPSWLAREVADCLPDNLAGAVLDPTVGGGALLSAVCERFSDEVTALGIDIDPKVLQKLRSKEPGWVLSRADLLSRESRQQSRAWRQAKTSLSAVVVNPPFSYRGNEGASVSLGSFQGRAAPAMHFLIELMTELSPSSGFFAILPDGALDADKHRELWAEIQKGFAVNRLNRFATTSFRGARVATSLVHLKSLPSQRLVAGSFKCPVPAKRPNYRDRCLCVDVIRGRVPVHSVKGATKQDGPLSPFLHTTTLARMHLSDDYRAPSSLADDAPFILLTRVGRWSSPIAVEIGRVVLSDCLFGLRPRDRGQLDHLRGEIDRARTAFVARYKGTGAKYLTLTELVEQIEQLGWHPHVVKASSRGQLCCCGYGAESCGSAHDEVVHARLAPSNKVHPRITASLRAGSQG